MSESSEEGDAVQAFEALRAEVALLRRAIQQRPDYTLSLGEITKGLAQVSSRLGEIEQHPALRMTPAHYQHEIVQAGQGAMQGAVNELRHAAREIGHRQKELAVVIGSAQQQDQQFKWLLVTGTVALLLGLFASPFFARLLPFGLDGRVAATIMATDRWHAGAALMEAGSPEAWRDLEAAATLLQLNQTPLAACRAAAAKTHKDQRCAIGVPAP